MKALPHIDTIEQLEELVNLVGMLPLFSCHAPGFSVMDITSARYWWSDDPVRDPWQWRMTLAASGKVAYGKVFGGKAGFISLELYPDFANFRRDGYDFDALYEDGKAPRRWHDIMALFEKEAAIPSNQIKEKSGVDRGLQGALTKLQMCTYLTIGRFKRRKNKRGEEYGWPIADLTKPEDLYGDAVCRSGYCREPGQSRELVLKRLEPYMDMAAAQKLLK